MRVGVWMDEYDNGIAWMQWVVDYADGGRR